MTIPMDKLDTFDDVIAAIHKAIDDVKIGDLKESTFCHLINNYFAAIDKVKQQVCGATPKGPLNY